MRRGHKMISTPLPPLQSGCKLCQNPSKSIIRDLMTESGRLCRLMRNTPWLRNGPIGTNSIKIAAVDHRQRSGLKARNRRRCRRISSSRSRSTLPKSICTCSHTSMKRGRRLTILRRSSSLLTWPWVSKTRWRCIRPFKISPAQSINWVRITCLMRWSTIKTIATPRLHKWATRSYNTKASSHGSSQKAARCWIQTQRPTKRRN